MKITVIAHPNSKIPRIEKDLLGTLHIYVKEAPLEGKANEAIIHTLAKHFNIHRNQVQIIFGFKSKIKVIELPD